MDSHKMRRIRIRVCVSSFPFGMWISFEILAQETISTDPFFQRAIVQVAAVYMQIIALLKTLDDYIR